jgi:hypothetical protein
MAEIATITNNVLIKIRKDSAAAGPRQRAVLGILGRNTASSPIAGSSAQT